MLLMIFILIYHTWITGISDGDNVNDMRKNESDNFQASNIG